MLTHLHIKDFTLVDSLDIELHEGLTVITGETGAGKSILLDALGLTLGDRTDASKVRAGQKRAEIQASFDLGQLSFARQWISQNDLGDGNECILRRVITSEGRSRAYINGHTVTLQQLKNLGERLIDIHSQHEHQSLLSPATHRRLVDEFSGGQSLAEEVGQHFSRWSKVNEELQRVKEEGAELNARFQLLSYQVEELDQLAVEEGEVESLEREQRILECAEQTQVSCQGVADICGSDGVGLKDRINQALKLLSDLPELPEKLENVANMLEEANIQVSEAQSDIERFLDSAEQDPERLHTLNERLDSIYDVARKHRVAPETLAQHHETLAEELSQLKSGDEWIEKLERELKEHFKLYQNAASRLSEMRQKAAKKLSSSVNKKLQELAMESAKLTVALTPIGPEPSRHGNEKIEFLISTNPGQTPQALQKVASGGELSRVSLAIQVVTAQTSTTPTLVFDEVDVGIGGTTGDVVGLMLSELGANGQIFCVTHLAQVASKAHHHLRVDKHVSKTAATSRLTVIEGEEKILEIARMMGGMVDSKQSLAHAKEMLDTAR